MENITQKLRLLGEENGNPCITISFNTHRTHPDNEQDRILLKKFIKDAEDLVIEKYGKRPGTELLDKLSKIGDKIDINNNLESLHLFISENTEEIIRSIWNVQENEVYLGDHFMIRPLIKAANRMEQYYILVLSAGGVQLYEAMTENIIGEVKNEDFPFGKTPHYITHSDKASDAKQGDNMLREYFNKVDKALIKVLQQNKQEVVVAATRSNFDLLKQVADLPDIYKTHVDLNYNESKPHQLSEAAWKEVKELLYENRTKAIAEVQDAISTGGVSTDLQEIYQAAINGRGELLVVNQDYSQPAIKLDDEKLLITDDLNLPNVEKDIVSFISWKIISQGGRVIYTRQEELNDLGKIALKVRY